jgi:hypothetical protein
VHQAGIAHKPVMMFVGGPWCSWCRTLDSTFNENPQLAQQVIGHYVVLHVYAGEGGKNDDFLGKLPEVPAVPWIFVFDPAGKLVVSQDTTELQQGGGYDPEVIAAFATAYTGG